MMTSELVCMNSFAICWLYSSCWLVAAPSAPTGWLAAAALLIPSSSSSSFQETQPATGSYRSFVPLAVG